MKTNGKNFEVKKMYFDNECKIVTIQGRCGNCVNVEGQWIPVDVDDNGDEILYKWVKVPYIEASNEKGILQFIDQAMINGGVYNDTQNVWVVIDNIQYTIAIENVVTKEEYPFQASEIMEEDYNHIGWDMLYNQYISAQKED